MIPYRTTSRRLTLRGVFGLVAVVSALSVTMASQTACTDPISPANVVKTTLDVIQYACVIANADLPNVPAIEKACDVDTTLGPVIQAIVSNFGAAKQKALADAKAAMKCP